MTAPLVYLEAAASPSYQMFFSPTIWIYTLVIKSSPSLYALVIVLQLIYKLPFRKTACNTVKPRQESEATLPYGTEKVMKTEFPSYSNQNLFCLPGNFVSPTTSLLKGLGTLRAKNGWGTSQGSLSEKPLVLICINQHYNVLAILKRGNEALCPTPLFSIPKPSVGRGPHHYATLDIFALLQHKKKVQSIT